MGMQKPSKPYLVRSAGKPISRPEPPIINDKTLADFTRVVEQTGILRSPSEGEKQHGD